MCQLELGKPQCFQLAIDFCGEFFPNLSHLARTLLPGVEKWKPKGVRTPSGSVSGHRSSNHDLIWQPERTRLTRHVNFPTCRRYVTYRPLSYIFHYLPTLFQDVHPIFSHIFPFFRAKFIKSSLIFQVQSSTPTTRDKW